MIQQSHFWYIFKENEIRILNGNLHSYVFYSIIHNSQDMETRCLSVDEWIKKTAYRYI